MLLRKGSAGSNTITDHLTVLDEAITQISARYRRNLLITVDGAGASHGLVDHITTLNASPGARCTTPSAGSWARGNARPSPESPASAWGTVLDSEGQPRDPGEAGLV